MAKDIIPYNFDEIYSKIEEKFVEKGYDAEEGSNTMQLVTAMSYLVSMLNANTATNIKETLLTQARKRKTALLDARVLGYEIEHVQSYVYDVTLRYSEIGEYTIPKFSLFTAGDKKYYYMGIGKSVTVEADPVTGEPIPVDITIPIKEGDLKTWGEQIDGSDVVNDESLYITVEEIYDPVRDLWAPRYFMDVPYTNVEDDGLDVTLEFIDELGNVQPSVWKRSKQFMIDSDTILNQEYVRLDDIDFRTPRIYFKLGDVGKNLRIGTKIKVNALISSGTLGEMPVPLPVTALNGEVLSCVLVRRGSEEEELQSIKENAPIFNNTANRVVTKNDYTSFCTRQSEVKHAKVWDGNDTFPPDQPGVIWFSFVPSNVERTFTMNEVSTEWNLDLAVWNLSDVDIFGNNKDKDDPDYIAGIFGELNNYKIPTLEFRNRHPIYLDFHYNIHIVKYPINSRAVTNQNVFRLINNYFSSTDNLNVPVETFDYEYYQSNLIKRIDTELTDIVGFNMSLSNSITFNMDNIVDESQAREFIFFLHHPFEGPIKETVVRNEFDIEETRFILQPIIDTEKFISDGTTHGDLYVDFQVELEEVWDAIVLPIFLRRYTDTTELGTEEIGSVEITKSKDFPIKVTLYLFENNGHGIGITEDDITNSGGELTLNVQYPSPNIIMSGNSIPRLKSVKFT